jgi:hypothetical protein
MSKYHKLSKTTPWHKNNLYFSINFFWIFLIFKQIRLILKKINYFYTMALFSRVYGIYLKNLIITLKSISAHFKFQIFQKIIKLIRFLKNFFDNIYFFS